MITAIGLPLGVELRRVLGRLDHDGRLRPLAPRPDHLDVVGVADERDEVAAVGVPPRLGVHLRDERADGVDDAQPAALAVLAHGRRDAVRREDADRTGGDLVLVIDEDRAEPLEPAARRGRCGRSRGGRRPAARAARAGARRSRSRGRPRRRTSAARRAGRGLLATTSFAASPSRTSARCASRAPRGNAARRAREHTRQRRPVVAAVLRDAACEPSERARRRVADGAQHPAQAPARGEQRRSRCRPRRRRSARAGAAAPPGRRRSRPQPGSSPAGPVDAERAALPEHRALLVDHSRRVDHGARSEAVPQSPPATPNETSSLRRARRSTRPGRQGPSAHPSARRGPLLGGRRAGERHPVSVHAMLRTVSLTLPVASKAADGSKPGVDRRSARSGRRCPGRTPPTRSRRAGPRTSGRSRL